MSLTIGVSACLMPPDPKRVFFGPKTLLYVEQSMNHWLMESGAVPFLIPTASSNIPLSQFVDMIDGLLLQGGSDVSPKSYGRNEFDPRWPGDFERDQYEINLVKLCLDRKIPIFGACRGMQIINVAMGGSLFQDIESELEYAQQHRDAKKYDKLFHEVELQGDLQNLYSGQKIASVNSVHHQCVRDLAPNFAVEAISKPDKIIEAISYQGDSYIRGVQWHPEFPAPNMENAIAAQPLLDEFLKACKQE